LINVKKHIIFWICSFRIHDSPSTFNISLSSFFLFLQKKDKRLKRKYKTYLFHLLLDVGITLCSYHTFTHLSNIVLDRIMNLQTKQNNLHLRFSVIRCLEVCYTWYLGMIQSIVYSISSLTLVKDFKQFTHIIQFVTSDFPCSTIKQTQSIVW
jgi:hypothetical protein